MWFFCDIWLLWEWLVVRTGRRENALAQRPCSPHSPDGENMFKEIHKCSMWSMWGYYKYSYALKGMHSSASKCCIAIKSQLVWYICLMNCFYYKIKLYSSRTKEKIYISDRGVRSQCVASTSRQVNYGDVPCCEVPPFFCLFPLLFSHSWFIMSASPNHSRW